MTFSVNDFADLLQIIETHPEWRRKLREILFPEIDIPQAFQRLTAIIERLDARMETGFGGARTEREAIKQNMEAGFAEARTEREAIKQNMEAGFAEARTEREAIKQNMEAGFAEARADREAIKQDVKRLDNRMEAGFAEARAEREAIKQDVKRLDDRVEAGFAEARTEREVIKQNMEAGFAEARTEREAIKQDVSVLKQDVGVLKQDVGVLKQDVATLKGRSHEQFYREKADAIFGRYLRRGKSATAWIADQLQEALETAQISAAEYEQVLAADLLWQGEVRQTRAEIILVLEASWFVETHDVIRAMERAAILRRVGLKALPVIAGREWSQEAVELAFERKVVQTKNGQVDATSWQDALSDLS